MLIGLVEAGIVSFNPLLILVWQALAFEEDDEEGMEEALSFV